MFTYVNLPTLYFLELPVESESEVENYEADKQLENLEKDNSGKSVFFYKVGIFNFLYL